MRLATVAAAHPDALVRLFFRTDKGEEGSLVTTAAHAVNPNLSGRFFPPEPQAARDMGWPVPYWYAAECWAFELVRVPVGSRTQ